MLGKVSLDNYDSLNDFMFYKYMCEEGNEKLQKSFLESIGVTIKGNLKIKNQKLAPEIINHKTCIFDFVAETKDSLINIELQQQKTRDFNERVVYYMNKLTNLKKGNSYKETRNIVLIAIVNFNMNKLPNYKHIYKLINTKELKDIFIEKLTIIIIELPKFRKTKKDLKNKEHLYLTFIDSKTSHNKRKELGKMDEGLKTAVNQIEKTVQNEEALRAYYKIEIEKMAIENQM